MRIFYCDHRPLPLPPGHRFPVRKYALLRQAVIDAGLAPPAGLQAPEPATDEQLLRAHDADYLQRVKQGRLSPQEVRRIGLPWSPELVQRARCSVGGTIAACRAALQDGVAVSLAGGTHHAFRDHGQGYCLFNDVVVAARTLQVEGRLGRVVVLDCDAHQGNGTAALAAGDPSLYTFSIHGRNTFPLHREPSDLDVEVDEGVRDLPYLEALDAGLRQALARAGARPDLAVYLAGADPYEDDLLGCLGLSKAGLAERDRLVFEHCRRAGLPVAVVMAGGYARRVEDTVSIHLQTVRIAASFARGAG